MTILPALKHTALLVGVLGIGLDLSACTGFREAVGTIKTPPDEFTVTTRAPLALPPELTLRPPQPGAGSGNEANSMNPAGKAAVPRDPMDLAAALGASYSDGEKFLLTKSNALAGDPTLRQTIVPPLPAIAANTAPPIAAAPPVPAAPASVTTAKAATSIAPAPIAAKPPAPATAAMATAAPATAATATAAAAPAPRPRRTLFRYLFGSGEAAPMESTDDAATKPVAATAAAGAAPPVMTAPPATTVAMAPPAPDATPPRRTLYRYLFGSGDSAPMPQQASAPASTPMTAAAIMPSPTSAATSMPPQRRTLYRYFFGSGDAAPMAVQQASAQASTPAPAATPAPTASDTSMPAQRRTLFRLLFPPAEAATM